MSHADEVRAMMTAGLGDGHAIARVTLIVPSDRNLREALWALKDALSGVGVFYVESFEDKSKRLVSADVPDDYVSERV